MTVLIEANSTYVFL